MTFSDKVRKALDASLGKCPTCGETSRSLRELADKIGVAPATLLRFRKGRGCDSDTLDKLVAWLKVTP